MVAGLVVSNYDVSATNVVSFTGRANLSAVKKVLPSINIKTPKNRDPVKLPGVSFFMAEKIIECANKLGVCVDDFLREYLKHLTFKPNVIAEASKTAIVGKTKVTTLIDGEQIFAKTVELLKSAKKSILIEMFEFQNLKIDSHKWPSNGAEVVPGFSDQQSILPILISKKRENPDLKIQVILDVHKWYMDGNGGRERHYNNQDMIRYLKLNGIDVVPYPRAAQQGAALQHIKMLAIDGKKALLGGMNWGNHSAANHDACIAIETLPKFKNSEVDNLIEEHFNTDWKFAWQRLSKTKLVAGPLTKDEQKFYKGIRKEIKEENVRYMQLVGDLFNTPEYRQRYNSGDLSKLNLTPTNPVSNPQIKILGTKPKELAYIGKEGAESTRNHLIQQMKTCKKVRGELFVLSDKELIEIIVKRVKNNELDAQFIVSSDILEEFPYCRKAYNTLVSNGVPVRLYNFDEKINQRLHCKWAVFDDNEVMIGSTNWSAMGLNQNLSKGMRGDYELFAQKIDSEISAYLSMVSDFEKKLGIKPMKTQMLNYSELLNRRKQIKKAIRDLNKEGSATITLGKKKITFDEENKSDLRTIQGYYGIIKDRHNAKEKYHRGNNECAVAFKKPSLARVFLNQFKRDWLHSVDKFEDLTSKVFKNVGSEMQSVDVVV